MFLSEDLRHHWRPAPVQGASLPGVHPGGIAHVRTVPFRAGRMTKQRSLPIVLTDVVKTYELGRVPVPVLKGINLLIRPGLFTVLLGPSGSGKTTLLNLIGCIDRPNDGQIQIAGRDVGEMDDDELSDFRARHIGFVFQHYNLLPVLTAFENVEYPLLLTGMTPAKRRQRVERLLEAVGLSDRRDHLPNELSGGQRQRVAIARALARGPALVIADEPTANLDSRTAAAILQLMRKVQQRYRVSFLFSSHDPKVVSEADDIVYLKDGIIEEVRRKPQVEASP
jgi:putative ABC transport system ATP-binding protein